MSIQAAVYYVEGIHSTGTKSFTLDTIPRKSTLLVGNGTLGTAQALTVTRKSTSFTHTIVAKCGSASTTICSKSSSTSISFTPPLAWASQNTSGTSLSVTYTITTYNGSTSIGSNSYTKTCSIPASVKPSCKVTVEDANGYLSTYGAYIKGKSKFKVVVTPTIAYGSAIASYSTAANSSTYTAASFTTGALKSYGTLTVKATVKDKRGRSGTASASLTVWDYASPSITKLEVRRCNSDGTANDQGEYVQVTFSGKVTSLESKNTATYTLYHKKTSDPDSAYTAVTFAEYANNYAVSNATYIFAADASSSYNVRVIATDDFDSGSKATTASTGFTIMHWLASGLGMGIGKLAELAGVLDIGFKTRFMGGILHPVLEPETDLNDVRTPNTYVGANVSTYNYGNCPAGLTSGTFSLEVIGMGEEGQVKQKLTYCHKTAAKAWERIYYSSAWGEWVCVSDFGGKLLWSGSRYMSADHDITLPEPISKQRSGIALVFSGYSGGSLDDNIDCKFVPKYAVSNLSGAGYDFVFSTVDFSFVGAKKLYISDGLIDGHDDNILYGTQNGVTFDNRHWVLRYVLGV